MVQGLGSRATIGRVWVQKKRVALFRMVPGGGGGGGEDSMATAQEGQVKEPSRRRPLHAKSGYECGFISPLVWIIISIRSYPNMDYKYSYPNMGYKYSYPNYIPIFNYPSREMMLMTSHMKIGLLILGFRVLGLGFRVL